MQNSSGVRLERIQHLASWVRIATALLLLAMFIGTHIPLTGAPGIAHHDKLLHASAYMTLTVFLLASWELSAGMLRPQHYFAVWLFGTVYGAFDEVTQIPVGRVCDGMDWLADIVGIVVGLIVFRLARPLLYRWL